MHQKILRTVSILMGLFLSWASSPAWAAAPGKTLWENLTQLAQVQSIEIHDDWMGLSQYGPVGRAYQLKPEGAQFVGKVVFSLGGGPRLKTKEEALAVPKASIQEFLNLLAQSRLEKGEYQPKIEHTDDYPSVSIDVQFASAKLSFYSKSQGEFATPWGVKLGEEAFITNSKNPAMAMKVLQPFFKHEDMEKFMKEYVDQFQGGR